MVRIMTDTDSPSNVTPLHLPKDRTAAERARRFRRRKRKAGVIRSVTPAVTAPMAPTVTPAVTPVAQPTVTETFRVTAGNMPQTQTIAPSPASGGGVTVITLIAALSLATVSAGISITGLTTIFIGAYWSVIGLGCAFEIGKLSAVAYL